MIKHDVISLMKSLIIMVYYAFSLVIITKQFVFPKYHKTE